jgi:hypothetical protein
LLIGAGVVALLDAFGAFEVNLTVVLASGLAVVGLALVVSTWFGRAHGLILVGVLLLAATAVSSVIDVPLRGGMGNHVYRPANTAELRREYHLTAGRLDLDLRDVHVRRGVTRVDATNGFGMIDVDVPTDVRVVVTAHAGAGSLQLFGRESDGIDTGDRVTVAPLTAGGTRADAGTLDLDLRVGAGAVRIRRFDPVGDSITVPEAG